MFYLIRYIFTAVVVIVWFLLIINITRKAIVKNGAAEIKSNPIKAKNIIVNIIIACTALIVIHLSYYPFEQDFITFSSEEAAFSYISKDITKLERYETDDAIFYVERVKDGYDKLFSITKLDNKFSFVNYNCQVDYFDKSKMAVTLKTIYNKNTNTTFYNLDIVKKQPYEEIDTNSVVSLEDSPMTYSAKIQKNLFLDYDAFCFYMFEEGMQNDKINIFIDGNIRTVFMTHYLDIPVISGREREF